LKLEFQPLETIGSGVGNQIDLRIVWLRETGNGIVMWWQHLPSRCRHLLLSRIYWLITSMLSLFG